MKTLGFHTSSFTLFILFSSFFPTALNSINEVGEEHGKHYRYFCKSFSKMYGDDDSRNGDGDDEDKGR